MKIAFRGGREVMAKSLRGIAPATDADWRLLLFVNDAALTPNMDPGDLSLATFGGYAPIAAQPGDTGPITWDVDDAVVRLIDDAFVWDCTSDPETIYGWVLWDDENAKLLFGEKYDTPHVLSVGSRHTLYVDIAVGQCG